MYRLNFLACNDLYAVEDVLKKRFSNWASEYTLTNEWSLSVTAASIKNVDTAQWHFFTTMESVSAGAIQESACNWGDLIFNDQRAFCPSDEYFPVIVARIKQRFFGDVLAFDHSPVVFDASKKMLQGIDAYYCIEIKGPSFGVIKVLLHQSYLSSFVDKAPRKKVPTRLAARLSAVSSLKVSADVRFDFGVIPFDQLIQLNSTRVLSSPNGVKNQFKMSINGVNVCNVAVGKRGDKKAFLMLKEQSV